MSELQNSGSQQTEKSAETEHKTLTLNPEQATDLVTWLNISLRDTNLRQGYAERLNDMFVQLTGNNHSVWEERGGKYQPDEKKG